MSGDGVNVRQAPEPLELDVLEPQQRVPWIPSTSPLASASNRCLSGQVFNTMVPSGWPEAYAISGLFDPPPSDAPRFIWETDDSLWVHGALADGYLRKMMAKGSPYTQASRVASPMSPEEAGRCAVRRLSCQMNISKSKTTACNCMCEKYSPVLFVPFSILDEIEVKNQLRPAAALLCAEANIGASLRRAGLQRADLTFEAIEKQCAKMPKSHRIRFAIRPEKVSALLEEAGSRLMTDVSRTLERAEYEVNMKTLGDLKKWVDKYRSIKARGITDTRDDEAPSSLEMKCPGLERTLLCCQCGHAEMWHLKPIDDVLERVHKDSVPPMAATQTLPPSSRSGRPAASKCLVHRVPVNIANRMPLQESFPMITGAPKPRAPRRVHSDPMICSGSLWTSGAPMPEKERPTTSAEARDSKTPPDTKPSSRRSVRPGKSRAERRSSTRRSAENASRPSTSDVGPGTAGSAPGSLPP